jgi:hypothetical protein
LWNESIFGDKILNSSFLQETQGIPYPSDTPYFKANKDAPRQANKELHEQQIKQYNEIVEKSPRMNLGTPIATALMSHLDTLKQSYQGLSTEEIYKMTSEKTKNQEKSRKNPSNAMKIWDRYSQHMINYKNLNITRPVTVTDNKSTKDNPIGTAVAFATVKSKRLYVKNNLSGQEALEHEMGHSFQDPTPYPLNEGPRSVIKNQKKYGIESSDSYILDPAETGAWAGDMLRAYYRNTGEVWNGSVIDLIKWGKENDGADGADRFQSVIDNLKITHEKDPESPSPESFIQYLDEVINNVVKGGKNTKGVNYAATGGMAYLEDGAMVNPFMQFAENTTGRKKNQLSGFDPAAAAIRAMQLAKEEEERPEKERKALEAMRIALPKKEYLEQEKNFRESTMNRASQKFDPETQLRMDENDAQDIKALHYLGYMGAGVGIAKGATVGLANNLSAHGVKSSFGHLGKEVAGEIGTEVGIMGTEKSGGFLTNKLIGRSTGGPVSYLKLGTTRKQFQDKAKYDPKKLFDIDANSSPQKFADEITAHLNNFKNKQASDQNESLRDQSQQVEKNLIGNIGTSNSVYARSFGEKTKKVGEDNRFNDASAKADELGMGTSAVLPAGDYKAEKIVEPQKKEKKKRSRKETKPLDPPTETTTTEPPLSGDPETRKKQQEDKIEKAAAAQRKKDAIAEEQIQRKKAYDAKIEARRQQAIENGRLQARLNAGGNAIPAAPAVGQAGAAAGVLGQQVMGGIQAGAGMLGNIMGGLNPLGQAGAGAGAVGAGIANPTTNLLEQLQNYFSENFMQLSGGGKSTATSDTIPAMLTPGEFVVNARSSAKNASLLHDINSGKDVEGFATGGSVGYYAGGTKSSGGGGGRASDRLSSAASKLSESASKLSDAASKISPSQANVNPIVNSRDSSSFVEIKGSSFDKLTQVLNSGFKLNELSSVLKTEIRINQSDMGQLLGSMGTFGNSIGSFSTAIDKFSSSATNFNTEFVTALTNFDTYITNLKAAAALIPTQINIKGDINTNVSVGMDATTIQFAVQQVVQDVSDEMKRMINDAIDRSENGI